MGKRVSRRQFAKRWHTSGQALEFYASLWYTTEHTKHLEKGGSHGGTRVNRIVLLLLEILSVGGIYYAYALWSEWDPPVLAMAFGLVIIDKLVDRIRRLFS